jgi:hypothetical protein
MPWRQVEISGARAIYSKSASEEGRERQTAAMPGSHVTAMVGLLFTIDLVLTLPA